MYVLSSKHIKKINYINMLSSILDNKYSSNTVSNLNIYYTAVIKDALDIIVSLSVLHNDQQVKDNLCNIIIITDNSFEFYKIQKKKVHNILFLRYYLSYSFNIPKR